MRLFLLVTLCIVSSKDVVAEGENELKRGTFPYMAFIYYPDESILDTTGARFTRGAVLISHDWLISSSDVSLAFPKKTLLARLGAVIIDSKFTLNEDEEEQEREVILIIRPYNYSATEWWNADISLLKTLLSFNSSLSVASAPLVNNAENTEKPCFILIYATSHANATERYLMQLFVDLLPPTQENCGEHFKKETMICATDIDDKPIAVAEDFCQGNSGGPLICDNDVTGIQTYINDCKQPHFYQLISVWANVISCATQERYSTEQCADVCVTISKDPPVSSKSDIFIAEIPKTPEKELGELTFNQSNNYEPTKTSILTEQETIATIQPEISKSMISEIAAEQVTDTTSTSTLPTTENTNTEEDVLESTEEVERKSHIEAKQQLVRSNASTNIPRMFHYFMTSVSVLACLT